jgi:hypothetical protein
MNIENVVTITQFNASYNAHIESKIWLNRPRRLTLAGAERIIRRERPNAVAIAIQYLTRA